MDTLTAKNLVRAVKANTQGNAYEYFRQKYVTCYGKTVFRMESDNGKNWIVTLNSLEPERFATILTQFPGLRSE
jgi:hypothetical protein